MNFCAITEKLKIKHSVGRGLAGRERDAVFAPKEYHPTAIRIVFSPHGDYSFPLMEIISVTRGDHPSDPWRLSPSTKGMLPLPPARLIDNAKIRHSRSALWG